MSTADTLNHSRNTRAGNGTCGPTAGSVASGKAGGRMGISDREQRSFASGLRDSDMRKPLSIFTRKRRGWWTSAAHAGAVERCGSHL